MSTEGASGCPPPPAPEVAVKFVETYDSRQDFSATVTIISDRGTLLQEVWFKKPNRFRVHYLDERSTDSGRPTKTGDLVVFDGETQWHYVNATGNVLYASAQSLNYTFGR
ncbi:LolA family protein [Methanoculleus sp. 7T]|uniref:LolA family protein n=1 Tax=Methanoculleus sp. 7T TaxID=2937282 RepID=UPI0020C185CE|nr:hypothetical protein [Methanoculleus sp. 7T]MCK8518669.1 hypothetical protein [Methanoculleus sp. 7T]